MENLLTPDFGLTFWTIITFLVLVAVLGKYAWGPLIRALDEREAGIRQAVAQAEKTRQAAEALKAQNEVEWAKVREKSDEMLKAARIDAERLRADMVKKAEEDAKALRDQTQRQIEEDRARLSRELRHDIAALSVRVAEKLLRQSMNAKEQERLAAEFLSDLDKEPSRP